MTSTPELDDQHWMRLALQLAAKGQGHVEPNPMVGCVVVKDGQCIAQGYHHRFGGPHAEVDALQSLRSADDAAGATVYVTLEPCCHVGKTPPCSLALIDAQCSRVVIAMRDPFPSVDGGGVAQLRDAGIEVTVDVLRDDAKRLNAPYLKRLGSGVPWLIAKWAMTIDGRIATRTGESQWITGPSSRIQVHRLRGRVDAILVGAGTVIADDPMLNSRLSDDETGSPGSPRIAKRVVLCRNRLPPLSSKLIRTAAELDTWLMASPTVDSAELRRLEDAGASVIRLETDHPYQMTRDSLAKLGASEMTNVMIESGPGLLGSFLEPSTGECLIDECHVYVGAKLFGGDSAFGPIGGEGVGKIDLASNFTLQQIDRFDDDVRMIYRLSRRLPSRRR